jgi:hypothetical protein
MRQPIVLLFVVLVAGCAVPGSVRSEGHADCPAPYVETSPRQALPGQELVVRGGAFLRECGERGGQQDLAGRFARGELVVDLPRVDASDGGDVVLPLEVPEGAKPGLARVVIGTAEPALMMIGRPDGTFPEWPGPPKGPFRLVVDLTSLPPHDGPLHVAAVSVDQDVQRKHVSAVAPAGAREVDLGLVEPGYSTAGASRSPGAEGPSALPGGCGTETRVYNRDVRVVVDAFCES